jgi:hypothetical protein
MVTGVGLVRSELRDLEVERVERNDGWRRQSFVQDLISHVQDSYSPRFVFSFCFFLLSFLAIFILCSAFGLFI